MDKLSRTREHSRAVGIPRYYPEFRWIGKHSFFHVSWVLCGYRVSSSVKEYESLMEKNHANISYKPGYDIHSLKQFTLLFSITLRNIMVPNSQMAELRVV